MGRLSRMISLFRKRDVKTIPPDTTYNDDDALSHNLVVVKRDSLNWIFTAKYTQLKFPSDN